MKIVQQLDSNEKLKTGKTSAETKTKFLPPVIDNMRVQNTTTTDIPPQLSPVDSLTNLLTEMTSTGYANQPKQSNK